MKINYDVHLGEFPKEIQEDDFLVKDELRVDRSAPKLLFDTLLYKLSYHRFADFDSDPSSASGFG